MKLEFVFEKETKNTIRFQELCEVDEDPVIGTLYIQKDALEEMNFDIEDTIVVELSVKEGM